MGGKNVTSKVIKVVEIFNDRELALNAGTDDGLDIGTTLVIKSGTPHQVEDPETGEVLGEIVRTKAVVRVYEAQKRFSLARTFRTRTVNVGGAGAGSAISKIFEAPRYETSVETLRRSYESGRPIGVSELIVDIGDIAEIIPGEMTDDVPSLTTWR
jgi:hypothetical protein